MKFVVTTNRKGSHSVHTGEVWGMQWTVLPRLHHFFVPPSAF